MKDLPVSDGVLGGLVAFYSIIHVRRQELGPLLAEFRRVLAPGGRLLMSAHEGDGEFSSGDFLGQPVPFVAMMYGLTELSDAVSEAGLDMARAERRSPYPSESSTFRLYIEAVRPR
jgi:SAM-dependent methyltransferase